MTHKTRKHCKKNQRDCLSKKRNYAKKGTQLKCRLKTCKAIKYQSVYGSARGGSIRGARQLFY